MHQQRLEHAAIVLETLKQRGVGAALNATTGDQLVGWGASIPPTFERTTCASGLPTTPTSGTTDYEICSQRQQST
jgi:hypothetical protein